MRVVALTVTVAPLSNARCLACAAHQGWLCRTRLYRRSTCEGRGSKSSWVCVIMVRMCTPHMYVGMERGTGRSRYTAQCAQVNGRVPCCTCSQ